ncbi:MAG: GNAT family N-acetyltransferase [Anaerolineaceae bacterium]
MEPKNLFEGRLVRLRALEPGDEEILFRHWKDTRITRLDSSIDWPVSSTHIREWIDNKTSKKDSENRHLVIETLEGRHVGGVNTQLCDPRNGVFSIGIGIGDREEWGKGYAREAMLLMLRFIKNAISACMISIRGR